MFENIALNSFFKLPKVFFAKKKKKVFRLILFKERGRYEDI